MNLLSGVLWIGGLAAAVAAVAQIARQSVRLREQLDELRTARPPEPTGVTKLRLEPRPMFGELYETKPNPLDGLASWPGVPLACAAAGLFAIGLVTNRPEQAGHGPADSTVAVELAAARLRHDSLAATVGALRDSLEVLQKRSTAANGTPARAAAARPARKTAPTQLARPATAPSPGIAPLPSLPKVASP